MTVTCCDTVVAGRIYISMGDLRFEVFQGSAVLLSAPIERAAHVSSNGRMFSTQMARTQSARISLVNFCKADPMVFWSKGACPVNITLVENDRNIRHHFTGAIIVGNPEKNLETGEVSGMEIHTDKYTTS